MFYFQPPYNTVTFKLVGDDTAKEYFQVDAKTGQVSVKKDLVLDPEKRSTFYVSI